MVSILRKFKWSTSQKIVKLARPFTTVKLLHEIVNHHSNDTYELKNLISQGHAIASYVPFIHNQTEVIVGNFLSVNYGIRNKISFAVGLVDKDFNVKAGKIHTLGLRQILFLSKDDFTEFNTSLESIDYCVVCAINSKIPKNHGGSSELRFWGVWNEFSSYVHSFPLPSPINFLRKKFNKLKDIPIERMTYPLSAKSVIHYGAFADKLKIKERGDLSGKLTAQYGYTILADGKGHVTSCFHNSAFTRKDRLSSKNISKILHVIPVPPLKGLDIDIFFGEVCSSGATFKASLWEKNKKDSKAICLEEKLISVNCDNALLASSIFNQELSTNKQRWIKLIPVSGLHDICFISMIYKNKLNSKLLDGAHSQTFKNNPGEVERLKKISPRSLKFAPFALSQRCKNYSFLTVFGEWQNDIYIRVRLFENDNPSNEILFIEMISSQEIKFINLIDYIPAINKKFGKNKLFVCQIESEMANLDGFLINATENKYGITRLAIDHLTGG